MASDTTVGAAMKAAWRTQLTEKYTAAQEAANPEGAGSVRVDQYGNRYRWVKNTGTVAAKAGAPACYDATDVAETTFLKACVTDEIATADQAFFAGVWMSAVAASGYGWIQTFGEYDGVRIALGSGGTDLAVGGMIVPNTATDTGTATSLGSAQDYSFMDGVDPFQIGTGNATSCTIDEATLRARRPHAVLLEGYGTGTATGSNLALKAFIRGLI
jgi:hypothetical protein